MLRFNCGNALATKVCALHLWIARKLGTSATESHLPALIRATYTARSHFRDYLGGEKAGKVGHGAANKVPFIIAVATRKNKPIYTQLRCVSGFTKEAIKAYAEANIAAGARIVSDGLRCFGGLADAGLKHKAVVTGSGRPKDERFKWTNAGLGNIKSAIAGTCRSFDPQHTERYLASYEWRFNRRFDLDKNVDRLARVAVQTAPVSHRSIAAVRS